MDYQLLHVFRNTPLGRETFMQSLYFCRKIGVNPVVYVPRLTKFLMYFDNDVVQVDLDGSYLSAPETAEERVHALCETMGCVPRFLEPKHYTASTLPDIPTDFEFMCCPRSVSDLSSKIGLGYIGPRVRRIVGSARFPVLITSPVYKPWRSVTVFFGGSLNALKALRLGVRISRETGMPIDLFTQAEKKAQSEYREIVEGTEVSDELWERLGEWRFFESGTLEENLYEVPHNALVVLGAYGHGVIRDLLFGSKLEQIQSVLSNNLLIAGPNYAAGY